MTRAFSTLGIKYIVQHPYEFTENKVVRAIKIVTTQSMKDDVAEEITLRKESRDGTYETEEYGEMPTLMMSTDAAWQRRSSGRRYDSASGVVHFIGVHSGKVCDTRLTINRCQVCSRIQSLKDKKQKAKAKKKESNIKKIQSKTDANKASPVHAEFLEYFKSNGGGFHRSSSQELPQKRNVCSRVLS